MFKKSVVLGLVLALGLVSQPALAGKKKPKPYKSEEFTLAVAHPLFYGQTGSVNAITAKEFESTCAIPSSNGLDAYVIEVPKAYQKLEAEVSAVGTATGGPLGYDLDMFLYDSDCKVTMNYPAVGTDEFGITLKGTAYVLVHNYQGDPGTTAHIELKP